MNFFNFGPLEIIFILIIMIIVLGPKKMVETAQSLGKFMRKIVKSPLWHTVMDTSRELRDLPTKLVRDAGLEQDLSELKKTKDSLTKLGNITIADTVTNPTKKQEAENKILSEEKNNPDVEPQIQEEHTPVLQQTEEQKGTFESHAAVLADQQEISAEKESDKN